MLIKNGGVIMDIPERDVARYIRAGYHVMKKQPTKKKPGKVEAQVEEVAAEEDVKTPANDEWKEPYKKGAKK